MDYLKSFLTDLTNSGKYYAEMAGNIGEIFMQGDTSPTCLIELIGDFYHVHFRSDIPAKFVAQLMCDMTSIDPDIKVQDSFMVHPDKGIVYGKDAQCLFFATIYRAMEIAREHGEEEQDDVLYTVKEPIYGYGTKNAFKDKMQRLWGADLE
jgi:hypothetical protein